MVMGGEVGEVVGGGGGGGVQITVWYMVKYGMVWDNTSPTLKLT